MLYHLPFWNNYYNNKGGNRTEHSESANSLIFKNVWKNLKKKLFCTLFLFLKKTGETNVPLQAPASRNIYECYGTDN